MPAIDGTTDLHRDPKGDQMGTISAIAAFASAAAACLAAFFAWRAVKVARRSADATALQTILGNVGNLPDVGQLRGEVRDALVERDANGGFASIRRIADCEAGIERRLLKLSVSFDRAAAGIVMTMDVLQARQTIELIGDVFADYWAICFEAVRQEQVARGDTENRVFFETLAYVSALEFERNGRRFQTRRWYIESDASDADSEDTVAAHMHRRIPEIARRHSVGQFVKQMGLSNAVPKPHST